jgi:hypothetical protein
MILFGDYFNILVLTLKLFSQQVFLREKMSNKFFDLEFFFNINFIHKKLNATKKVY